MNSLRDQKAEGGKGGRKKGVGMGSKSIGKEQVPQEGRSMGHGMSCLHGRLELGEPVRAHGRARPGGGNWPGGVAGMALRAKCRESRRCFGEVAGFFGVHRAPAGSSWASLCGPRAVRGLVARRLAKEARHLAQTTARFATLSSQRHPGNAARPLAAPGPGTALGPHRLPQLEPAGASNVQ